MLPTRSSNGNYAKFIFYQDVNDIDFFIEDKDENTRKIILELLQRTFSNEIQISQIFSLGGREKVIKQYENRAENRTQVFMIDGDLNLLFEQFNFQKGLVSLDKYCIENFLCDVDSVHTLLYEECPTETDFNSMCQEFAFQEWWDKQKKLLYRLFIEYAVEKVNSLGITTVKYRVERLSRQGELNHKDVKTRIHSLRNEIKNRITKEEYNSSRVRIIHNIKESSLSCESFVSGKDYILPLLFAKIKKYSSSTIKDERLKYRLSKICNTESLERVIRPHLIA